MLRLPAGCPFSERCSFVMPHCASVVPPLVPSGDVLRACHRDPADVIEIIPSAVAA
jgi:oligopeptide transport system ATP-binding protein